MKTDGWRLDLAGRRERRALTVGLIAILVVGASALVYLYPSGLRLPAAVHVGIGELVPYQPGATLQVPAAEGAANAVAAARAWPALLAFLARQRQPP